MREALTDKQKEVFDFIRDRTHRNRIPPSVRDVMKNFGWNSPQSAFQHMNSLERKGYLELKSGKFWPVESPAPSRVSLFRAEPVLAPERGAVEWRNFLTKDNLYRLEISAATFLGERVPAYKGKGPVPIDEVVGEMGYRIEPRYFEARISGQFVPDRNTVLVNARHPRRRQRFTLGHEIGHAILHLETIIARGEEVSCDGTGRMELEANYFAACLLIPSQALTRFVAEICSAPEMHRSYGDRAREEWLARRVSAKFDVSLEAAGRRLRQLRFISQVPRSRGAA